ncbi:helix-turn-helix domain-containing protein [Sutcliffiella halmapala]|uniref:helix-turn-helix domain-containing protein n=1 Tax=Sutcliffiella halmapala TaxID=79882 RepID=UPI000995DBA1|nr:helix-turn-helix transcriptional regulator [Sutcliffiella halmapala]
MSLVNYHELLTQYIEQSGLSLGELSLRLKNVGIEISKSYISKLKNGAKPPASDEINKAIAEVTGGDPNALIWCAYIEKAPETVKRMIDLLSPVLEAYNSVDKENPNIEYSPEDPRYESYHRAINEFIHEKKHKELYSSFLEEKPDEFSDTMHQLYLQKARRIIFETPPGELDQLAVINAITNSYSSLEFRLNQILYLLLKPDNKDANARIEYLEEFTLKDKLRNLLPKYLDYDITQEDFYLDLLEVINLRNKIAHHSINTLIKRDEAQKYVLTVGTAIESINSYAKRKGIE